MPGVESAAQTRRHARPAGLPKSALAAAAALIALQAMPAGAATSILFIGNSFTYGALASVETWGSSTVTDLNGTNIGGVPALFKAFTVQAGLDYNVSLETEPGSNLDFHYNNRLALINKPWDKVVMHGQSNLDFQAPNNPAKISTYTGILGNVFQAQNPNVDISLTATWSRADLTFANTSSPWYGQPITQMGIDVQAGYEVAAAQNPTIVSAVNPVGLAWNRAINLGIADGNPYDGIATGKINLWASDNYHASNHGYYLHALVDFGMITGIDPRSLGGNEYAALELGITASEAYALQAVAWDTIQAVPEPSTWLMLALGGGVMGLVARRRSRSAATA
ncbi:PEP-CTERM sorting domain-containing protein [Aquincola sp. MAHUQ-54]|uniref:PEP-CTERM sorting domain-containing protein n=1 Tax=Aquincola agrisoli TaxID=3119538 RepID=A0AAW9QPY4_9BURK